MDGELIETVSPKPVPAALFVAAPFLAGFLSFFPGMFAFVISNMFRGAMNPSAMSHRGPVLVFGLVAFVVSFAALMAYFAARCFVGPSRTFYRIYSDRIEFEEGLFATQKRTLLFDKVIDVSVRQGVLQQTVGVGTVSLVTQQLVSRGEGKLANRTIQIADVPNSNEVY
ncbi:PH domain-containing protein [Neorhodopirellula lusitana]|uniref:PH domain-containing protein n=1 Tax=Neorhodopirellula lusitana TaxID=445327 RepID=UPI00384E0470